MDFATGQQRDFCSPDRPGLSIHASRVKSGHEGNMSDQVLSIGVDLGGTKIEAAVLKRPRKVPSRAPIEPTKAGFDVILRERVATNRERGYESIVETAANLILGVAASAGVDLATTPVGVGMPGAGTRREGR